MIGLVTAQARMEAEKGRKRRERQRLGQAEERKPASGAHAAAEGYRDAMEAEQEHRDGLGKAYADRGATGGPSHPVQPGEIDAEDFTRGSLTAGHAADAPGNTVASGGAPTPAARHVDFTRAQARYEQALEVWERPLARELTAAGAGSDASLVAAAQALMSVIDEAGWRNGKYTVRMQGAQGVQIGPAAAASDPGKEDTKWWRLSAPMIAGIFTLIAAVIAGIFTLIAQNNSSNQTLIIPTSKAGPSGFGPTPSTTGQSTVGMVSFGALRAGDCIQGSDLHLANSNRRWPTWIQVVPCGESHAGEVTFSYDYWIAIKAYPGDSIVSDQGWRKCVAAFRAYVGTIYGDSVFNLAYSSPNLASWRIDDRNLLCVLYDPNGPLRGTVRDTRR